MAGYLLHPLVWCVGLFAAGLVLWKKSWRGRSLCVLALLLLLAFSSSAGAGFLVTRLERQYPDRAIETLPRAQAIVVLGGTIHRPSRAHPHSALIDPSDRILQAFRLYKAGLAPLVICVGGAFPGEPEAETMAKLLEEWGVPSEAVLRETRSLTTRENALFAYEALKSRGIPPRILLVTSAMHMPRAAGVFRKAGFEVEPSPADFHSGWGQGSWLEELLPDGRNLSAADAALREWIGMWVYQRRGWI